MSLTARLVTAALFVAGAALFVAALAIEDPEEPVAPVVEDAGSDQTGTPAARKAAPGVLDSPESCRECHAEIYAEWMQDRHSQAWVGALYTELSKNHSDSSCWACHAPRPILETGVESPAEARANYRETGINCLSCHKKGNHVAGPNPDPRATPEVAADCGPVFSPEVARADAQDATTRFCGVCHSLHGTDKEFEGSRYYREGMTCLSCHMEETVGPVAKGGKPRLRRVHRFPGGHSPGMLRRAMRMEARIEGERLLVRVINSGAGHRIPTDARHRAVWLRVAFYDAYGQPVPVKDPRTGTPGLEVPMDLIRLFYRQEQKEPTQIEPEGTLGKDNWRESAIAIPEAARGGRARLRLHYNLRWDWPPEKGTLVEEKEIPIG